MDLGLRGKRALILGGTSGIGYAIAECLAGEGAEIILAGREESRLNSAIEKLNKTASDKVTGLKVDLTQPGSIHEAFAKVNGVDILLYNVGGPATGSALTNLLEAWDKGYQTLLRGLLQVTQAVLPSMKQKKWGRLLTITSTSAREMIPNLPISGTFRAGLSAWVKSAAKELGRENILVNNLLPGPTNTERLKHLETESPIFFKAMAEETALGRIADPMEIARVAAFLVSAANTYVTGTDILADGGYTKSY